MQTTKEHIAKNVLKTCDRIMNIEFQLLFYIDRLIGRIVSLLKIACDSHNHILQT